MKYFLLFLFIIYLFACSPTVGKIDITPDLPSLDNSSYLDPAYKEAWKYLKDGKYDLAMETFQKSTIEDEKLFVGYGFVFLLQKKFNFAKDNFEKSIKINPDNIEANIGLGLLYELTNNYKKAFSIYSELKIKKPLNSLINKKYNQIKDTKTKEFLSKAENSDRNSMDYINYLKEALFFSPELIDIKIKIADFYEENGNEEKAAKYYELLLEESPRNIKLLNNLAKLYERTDKIEEAIVVYRRLSEVEPENIEISNKINDLKIKFFDKNLPLKFKDIFFKTELNKEDLAALIGFYFKKYLYKENYKVKIITDISKSFARKEIITVCSLGIMQIRPDHRFGRRVIIKRAHFAKVITRLIKFLKQEDLNLSIKPTETSIDPIDVNSMHKDYKLIKELINASIMTLDSENRFNQSSPISPSDAIVSLKKVLNSISFVNQ